VDVRGVCGCWDRKCLFDYLWMDGKIQLIRNFERLKDSLKFEITKIFFEF